MGGPYEDRFMVFKVFARLTPYLIAAFASAAVSTELIEPEPHYPRIARVVADGLPKIHVSHDAFGDEVAQRALTNLVKSLDFDHTYFKASDIASFEAVATELDDQLLEGNIDFAYTLFETFKDRMRNRVAYVKTLTEKGFDTDVKESYQHKRKEAPWAVDDAAWDELWRKKVKNEYVSRKVALVLKEREAAEKAAEKAKKKEAGEDVAEDGDEEEVEEEINPKTPEEAMVEKYDQFLKAIEGHDAEWVLQIYLSAFTRAYDTHSTYMSPRATEDFNIQMKLELSGIGAVLTVEDGAAKIEKLMPGGPAARSGKLVNGDKIIAVGQGPDATDYEDILYQPLYKSVRIIRGKKGTTVRLKIIPADDPSGSTTRIVKIVRDEIKLEDRAAKGETREWEAPSAAGEPLKLGVITLPDFYADMGGARGKKRRSSAKDVRALVEGMVEEDVDGIVLDLRDNGGGSLQDSIIMSGLFINAGPIVQVKSTRGTQALPDPDPTQLYDGPLVIMVNRHSASASEILAAAMQDYGRAVVVGDTQTHGKGTVQSLLPIDRRNNSMGSLKLTTAGFYRVSGGSTQLKGVEPDVLVPSTLDALEIGEKYLPNHLEWSIVRRAKYTPYKGLDALLPELQRRSQERLAASEPYQTYAKQIVRLEQYVARKELPLQYDERLRMAEEDKEITDMQRDALSGDSLLSDEEEEEEKKKNDHILKEGLAILSDLISLQAEKPAETEVEPARVGQTL